MTSNLDIDALCRLGSSATWVFGSLRVERLHGQRFVSRRHAKEETIAWLLWYNKAQLHSTLAYVSPVQFEQTWVAAQPRQVCS